MPTSRAPIARPDYSSASLAAVVAGGAGLFGFGALFSKAAGVAFIDVLKHAALVGVSDLPANLLGVLGFSSAGALACAGGVFYWLSGQKYAPVIHSEGGQVRQGAGAAKQIVKQELARSESVFRVAGLDFTADRIRRSFLILGSIGGGKTQVIWSLLQRLIKADYKILLIDGPKGDYSTSTPGDPLIIAPWHNGPSWDIARDCSTRGHARELARALVPVSERDPIWGNAAGMILIAILCKLQAEKGMEWGWRDLYEYITLSIDELRAIAEQHYPPAIQILADAESKTTQSVSINLTAFMADVYEMSLAWRDTQERFSFTDWWQGQGAHATQQIVILQGSGEFKSLAGGYISSILQLLANLTASPSFPESKTRKNIIIADEFAQLPKINGFEKFFEIGRSKGCSAIVATQSPAQLRKIWGEDDLQSWVSMIGTKIYARILGHLDAEMVLAELGEREVFHRTETITSSSAGNGQGSASVGWQKERVGVVRQEELAELGPTKDGIAALVQGFGKDPIQLTFPFINTPAIRPVFIANDKFNKPISDSKQPAPAITANIAPDESRAVFAEIADQRESTQVPAFTVDNTTEESDEHLLMQTSEHLEAAADYNDDMLENFEDETADNVVQDAVAAALGVDSHTVELAQELAELLNEETCKKPVNAEVSGVIADKKTTGKRGLFKKRNQRTKPENSGNPEA